MYTNEKVTLIRSLLLGHSYLITLIKPLLSDHAEIADNAEYAILDKGQIMAWLHIASLSLYINKGPQGISCMQ